MISRKNTISILLTIIFLSSVIVPSCCRVSQRKIIADARFLMGTDVQMKVSIDEKDDESKAKSAISKAFEEMERVESVFSAYKPDSEISKINRLRGNEKLQISREAFGLIKKSIEYSKITDGAFDITIKPLTDLWQAAKKNNRLPSYNDIKLALSCTGYEKVILDESVHTISFKKGGMALDLGGIAKGYATERAVKILKESGIKNAIVSSGGNLYCLGKKMDGELWVVAIRHPRNKDKVFMEIELQDRSIDTSGDYEKYFTLDNKRYPHIIDPRTGYPVKDTVISATVVSGEAAVSDMLATSLMILGQKGLNIAGSIKDVDAIVVFKNNDKFIVRTTDNIGKRYAIKEKKL